MEQPTIYDDELFPGFETLGNVAASSDETRHTWRGICGGMILAGVMVAAMLPTSLEQEIRALPPGPIEERMIEGVGWWRTQMTVWKVDLPANRLRHYVDELSRMDWHTGYCLLRATGLFDEKTPPPDLIMRNGGQVFECE